MHVLSALRSAVCIPDSFYLLVHDVALESRWYVCMHARDDADGALGRSRIRNRGSRRVACSCSLVHGRNPPCTERNSRTSPSNSVVVVASLHEGVAWCTAIRRHRSVVEFFGGCIGCELSSLSLIRRCRHFFFFLSLVFLLGLVVLFAPAVVSLLYRMFAILI